VLDRRRILVNDHRPTCLRGARRDSRYARADRIRQKRRRNDEGLESRAHADGPPSHPLLSYQNLRPQLPRFLPLSWSIDALTLGATSRLMQRNKKRLRTTGRLARGHYPLVSFEVVIGADWCVDLTR
jgi:hypothetical protein